MLLKARQSLPSIIERAAEQSVSLPVYLGDTASPTAPTTPGSTYSLLRPDGTALIDAEAVVVTGDVASYAISAAEVPVTEDLGEGWIEVWTLVVSGATYTIRREAAMVLRRLYCPITNADLLEEMPALATYRGDASSHEDAISRAWLWVQRRLIQAGRRPWLVIGSDALHEVTVAKALGIVLRDAALNVGEPERFLDLAAHYDREGTDVDPPGVAQWAWERLRLTYDDDEDGIIDTGEKDAGKYAAARVW